MTTNPADILKDIEREEARIRQEAAALERKKAEVTQLLELAAKYNMNISPAETPDLPEPKSVSDLIRLYKNTPSSPYQQLTHASKNHYDVMFRLIEQTYGPALIAELTAASFEEWHRLWSEGGKLASAYSKIKMVRIIVGFGTEVLHDRECERLFGILCKLKFEAPKKRVERLTTAQANAIREMARRMERPSIALAQAFQADIGLLQKDVIGEWVPFEENGVSEYTSKGTKWVRGIRWSEIDADLILRHQGNSWQDNLEFDLRNAPSVLEELRIKWGFQIDKSPRDALPLSGAIIISEYDKLPWEAIEFRRWWRQVADACGISKNVRNSDSRSRTKGNVQEADDDEADGRLAL